MDKEMLDNLIAAVSNGRTDIVRTLIHLYETRIKESALSIPCDEVLSLACNSEGTLLHLATKLDHVDIVRTLLCSGADPSVQNPMGETPYDLVQSQSMTAVYVDELLKCSAKSEINRIHQLVNAGVDINAPDSPESGNRALHWAVCFGKPEAVQCLLDLGAFPNVKNGQGATPLHEAVKRKNFDILKILLHAGADPSIKSTSGKYSRKSPLDLAEGHKEISGLLLGYVTTDTESERSVSNTNSLLDNTSHVVETELSQSLQSLSTTPDMTLKSNLSLYAPQPMNIPSFLFSPLPLITDSKLHLLWPQPQNIFQTEGPLLKLEANYVVHIVRGDFDIDISSILKLWSLHCEKFALFDIKCSVENVVEPDSGYEANIICHVNQKMFSRNESYKLIIDNEQIRVIASDILGLHYALCTLGQLFSLYYEDSELPSLFIHDWPQLQYRAVLLDFTLGARKPSMETLRGVIQTMSFLKLQQLHCYFRYDLDVGDKFPFTNKQFLELSHYCADHHVSLIPALDVGASAVFSDAKNLLVPVHQLMSLFSSKDFQVGPNLSRLLLEELVASKNPRLFWEVLQLPMAGTLFLSCSSIYQSPELLSLLPLNCVLIDYAYQVEYDYDYNAKFYTISGYNVCIGTGTKSWGSVAGCPESAISCIHKASVAASLNGSFGLIVADWKTLPHHPAFCFSWPGIILALGLAWNSSVHKDYLHSRLSELLNFYVYGDMAQITGYLNVELGRLEAFMHQSIFNNQTDTPVQVPSCQNSVLHQLLTDPDSVLIDTFTLDLLQQVMRHLKKFELELQKAKPTCFQHGEIISELRLAIDLLMFACRLSRVMISTGMNPSSNSCGLAVVNVGISNLPPISRTDLANKLLALTEQFRAVWLSRNLPCGLETSLCMFNSILFKLIPENEHSLYSINGNIRNPNHEIQFM